MRATNLQFRSPKEYTPSPYDVRVTKDGAPLQYNQRPISAKGTFSKESRFSIFRDLERRMPTDIGPGSYHYKNGCIEATAMEKGTLTYKKLHQAKLDGNDGAFIVGSLMLFEERFCRRKAKQVGASPLPQASQTLETKSSFTSRRIELSPHGQSTEKLPTLKPKSLTKRSDRAKASTISLELRRLLCYSSMKTKRRKPSKVHKRD